MNRSATDGCRSTSGTASRPSGSAQSASLAAAHSRFLARSRPSGAARMITSRANAAAGGDTDHGRHRAIYPAIAGCSACMRPPADNCPQEYTVDSSQPRGSETVCRMEPSPAQRAALDKITAELAAAAGPALPGTLTVRAYACGKPGCRCHADPPRLHGPYAEWTRKIGGKTITRRLTPAELADYQPLFDNAKKLRTLLTELQDLTLEIIETASQQP